jgi:hypothetical protein
VHTNNFDHSSALPNYLKRGFTIVEEVVLRVSVPTTGCRRVLDSRSSRGRRDTRSRVVLRALSAARFLPEEDVRPVPGSRSGCPASVADNG